MNLLIQDIARRYNYYHNTLAKPRIIAHQFEPNYNIVLNLDQQFHGSLLYNNMTL